jgi:uncharacterized protein (TIGR00730 family)
VPVGAPTAEIDELRWLDPARPLPADIAPLVTVIVPALPARRGVRRVTFFTGSATGNDPSHGAAVAAVAAECARRGLGIVYGGGKVGLMGVLADAALAAGGRVTGVMPQVLVDGEIAHTGLTSLEIVTGMTARKDRLLALGDATVALPGGAGTLEEFFQAWTWQQLGINVKPVVLYNAGGFWDPLLAAIKSMVTAGFLAVAYADNLIVVDHPADLIEALVTWQPPAAKWER